MFVTVEGVDYVGKSELVAGLANKLKLANRDVVRTREPGGTEMAEDIRSILSNTYNEPANPFAELLLITAARIQHVTVIVQPALDNGKIVLCDRYIDSTRAYQGIAVDDAYIEAFCEEAPQPDLTILLTCDNDVLVERAKADSRDATRYDKLATSQPLLQDRFLAIAKDFDKRIKTIDTTNIDTNKVIDISLTLVQGHYKYNKGIQ